MIDFSVNNQCDSTRFYLGACYKSTKRRKQQRLYKMKWKNEMQNLQENWRREKERFKKDGID